MGQDRVSHATPNRVVPSLMSSDSSPRVRPARASGWESLRTLVGGFYSKFCSTYFCTNSSSQRTFGQRHGKFSSSANGDFIDILDRSLSATPRDDIKVYVMSLKSHSRVNVAGRMSNVEYHMLQSNLCVVSVTSHGWNPAEIRMKSPENMNLRSD